MQDFVPANDRIGSFSTKFSGFAYRPLPLSPKSGHSASARFMSTRPNQNVRVLGR